MSRLLVTGSRDWSGRQCSDRMEVIIIPTMEFLRHGLYLETITVVHGAARGADSMFARLWGDYFGKEHIEKHEADWDTFGKAAGHIRNQEMVDLGADLCLAFLMVGAGNIGTKGCITKAQAKNIPVVPVWNDGKRHEL